MTRRIVYLDTFSWGTGHEMFNAGLLSMCIELSGDELVLCRATRSSYKNMVRLSSKNEQCRFKPVHTASGASRLMRFARFLIGAILCIRHLIFVRKNDLVVIPYNNLFAVEVINIICRWFDRRVVIFCHGEMEFANSGVNATGVMAKFFLGTLCRKFFLFPRRKIADGLRFSVMGESIKKNLKERLPSQVWEHFTTMDHPYFFLDVTPAAHKSNSMLHLGTCGVMTEAKGLDYLALFAQKCRDMNVSITHVGRVFGDLSKLSSSGIDVPSAAKELSREEYDRLISGVDILLFFYPSTNYRITASGAIMDALSMCKPIIALRNDYFEYFFNKFGAIGYLVDSVENMVELVRSGCISTDFDFDAIRAKLSPEALLPQLKAIFEEID